MFVVHLKKKRSRTTEVLFRFFLEICNAVDSSNTGEGSWTTSGIQTTRALRISDDETVCGNMTAVAAQLSRSGRSCMFISSTCDDVVFRLLHASVAMWDWVSF
jgi:hypothetical protein